MASPTRVLVVDDSSLVREILRAGLSSHPRIEVVATAADPYEARRVLESVAVDVVTLDLEMPRMDGLTFLRHLMRDHPLPVIIVSSLAGDREAALACLAQGAVDLVAKPSRNVNAALRELVEKILAAGSVDARRLTLPRAVVPRGSMPAAPGALIVVGASTGGPQALELLFGGLPADSPPVVAVIHMPAGFTKTFAARLDSRVPMAVKEAEDGETLLAGTIYIAPGGRHVQIRAGVRRTLRLSDGPRVFNQRPAVDVLFESAALGRDVRGILLTGMGKDGARGLKAIRDAGGLTVAQDEATSVVFGMPREAILLGAASAVLPLPAVADWVRTSFGEGS